MTIELVVAEVEVLNRLLVEKKQLLAALKAAAAGFDWQQKSDRFAYLIDEQQRYGWYLTVYIGFETKQEALRFMSQLKKEALERKSGSHEAMFGSVEVRQASRLLACKYELKITDLWQHIADRLMAEIVDAERLQVARESLETTYQQPKPVVVGSNGYPQVSPLHDFGDDPYAD